MLSSPSFVLVFEKKKDKDRSCPHPVLLVLVVEIALAPPRSPAITWFGSDLESGNDDYPF